MGSRIATPEMRPGDAFGRGASGGAGGSGRGSLARGEGSQGSASRKGGSPGRGGSPNLRPSTEADVTADLVHGGVGRLDEESGSAGRVMKQVLGLTRRTVAGGEGEEAAAGEGEQLLPPAHGGVEEEFLDGDAYGKVQVRMEMRDDEELHKAVATALGVGLGRGSRSGGVGALSLSGVPASSGEGKGGEGEGGEGDPNGGHMC